jgi:hypothetical protein
MAQVNIIQYAEIYTGSGPPLRIGSKVTPSTITLTGTGEVYHRVFNDITLGSATALYTADMTGLKWFAVKASTEIQIGFGTDASPDHNNAIVVPANIWQFFNSAETTEDVDGTSLSISGRATQGQQVIDTVYAYNALAADIEFIGAY